MNHAMSINYDILHLMGSIVFQAHMGKLNSFMKRADFMTIIKLIDSILYVSRTLEIFTNYQYRVKQASCKISTMPFFVYQLKYHDTKQYVNTNAFFFSLKIKGDIQNVFFILFYMTVHRTMSVEKDRKKYSRFIT